MEPTGIPENPLKLFDYQVPPSRNWGKFYQRKRNLESLLKKACFFVYGTFEDGLLYQVQTLVFSMYLKSKIQD